MAMADHVCSMSVSAPAQQGLYTQLVYNSVFCVSPTLIATMAKTSLLDKRQDGSRLRLPSINPSVASKTFPAHFYEPISL